MSVKRKLLEIFMKRPIVRKMMSYVIPLCEGEFCGIYQYCRENKKLIYEINDGPHMGRRACKTVEEMENEKHLEVVPSYRIYLGILNDVTIYGLSDVIRKDNMLLTDRFAFDRKYFDRYLPNWIKGTEGKVGYYFKYEEEHISKGIYLVKMWNMNWSHFLIESISRLQFVDQRDEYDDFPILIDECVLDDSRNVDVISALNVKNRDIIKISKDKMYHVETLIYPAQFSWFLFDVDKSNEGTGWAIDGPALKHTRDLLRGKYHYLDKPNKKRIFLARGDNRRLVNENEVSDFLKSKGFEIVNTADMTLEEEIDSFMNAAVVVSTMGSGLSNIIFCPNDALVVELCPIEFQYDSFAMIADAIGLDNYHLLNAQIVSKGQQINKSKMYLPREKQDQIIDICNRGGK